MQTTLETGEQSTVALSSGESEYYPDKRELVGHIHEIIVSS